MVKRIIFYGGCHGINKSKLLKNAIEILPSILSDLIDVINISEVFEEAIKFSRNSSDKDKPILWFQDDWKKYDKIVLDKLLKKIQKEKIYIINNHFSVLYKGKDNYLPGFELESLKNLLLKSFCNSDGDLTKVTQPCFGLLLIDPAPSLIVDYYTEKYKKEENNVLNYLSEQMILRDMGQNRIWASSYYDTANLVLGKKNVHRETIYITKELIQEGSSDVHSKIVEFLKTFSPPKRT